MATARSADAVRDACGGEQDRLHALALDITDTEAANAVAAETIERFGAIDVLVVDSVAALTPRAEIEGEMGEFAPRASAG